MSDISDLGAEVEEVQKAFSGWHTHTAEKFAHQAVAVLAKQLRAGREDSCALVIAARVIDHQTERITALEAEVDDLKERLDLQFGIGADIGERCEKAEAERDELRHLLFSSRPMELDLHDRNQRLKAEVERLKAQAVHYQEIAERWLDSAKAENAKLREGIKRIVRAAVDPDQPGESQRLADITQIAESLVTTEREASDG